MAQAALFVALQEYLIQSTSLATPWPTLTSRRFGGDVYERTISIQPYVVSAEPTRVSLKSISSGHFDVAVHSAAPKTLTGVSARLVSPTTLSTTLNGASTEITIVSQRPAPSLPAVTRNEHHGTPTRVLSVGNQDYVGCRQAIMSY
ncbi:hypothetical protein DEU56DRAFT_942231 [Suillus clintonianus]|uniref:uncharacterized protein n=1 Tax=Suillus clintonianus TaxID=1904413 RepID=UPI001B87760A|nr:uncharacterized protein DEU56DRAFT_942231 [Suillus clintonianus]KAG2139654.1 hypothetical protein DEU56DRAFT_942231 [Suillus clintonianus]